jgi:PH-interacting protein
VGPWASIKGNIRAVEFCKVEGLEYSSLAGSGDSCCKMTLQFVHPTSSVFRKSFKLTLPEVTGFPDFLVGHLGIDAGSGGKMKVKKMVVGGMVGLCL